MLLIAAYVPVCFRTLLPVMGYMANYDYYAYVLCENKNKPEQHCNGKCCLNKQIRKNSERSSENENSSLNLGHAADKTFHYFKNNILFLVSPPGKVNPHISLLKLFHGHSKIVTPPPKS